jgi:hypothetical protein
MQPALRIPTNEIRTYSNLYDHDAELKLDHVSEAAKKQCFITRSQLHEIALWKSNRRADLVNENEESFVKEITKFAFQAIHEYSKISSLVLLSGVQYPTASVILHFCVDDTYPILDFRAIWSLGLNKPTVYTPEYWVKYTNICRSLAKMHSLTVREFDMALWQYSKEHQNKAS